MIRLDIRFEDKPLEQVEQGFSQVTDPKIMQRVVNNTTTQVLKQILQQMAKTYAFKGGQKELKKYTTEKKATQSNPEASLTFKSQVLEPREYAVSPEQTEANITKPTYTKTGRRAKGKAVRVKVLKSTGWKALTGNAKYSRSFIVQFKSGHVAVVSREYGKKMKKNPKKDYLRKVITPSVAILAGNDKVYASSSDEIYRIMDEQTRKIVSKVLGGKK